MQLEIHILQLVLVSRLHYQVLPSITYAARYVLRVARIERMGVSLHCILTQLIRQQLICIAESALIYLPRIDKPSVYRHEP